jgi:hypothetical protein
MVVLAAVVGIIIWQFAPINEALNTVLPNFNKTEDNSDTTGTGDGGNPVSTPAPAPIDENVFEFNQCTDQDNCCNGLTEICDLGVNDIIYGTLHNANAAFENGFFFGPNHRLKLEGALTAGYRGLNLDVCNCVSCLYCVL